ncbi:hypothetical protein FCV25MIE_06929 [Fagus crenata]
MPACCIRLLLSIVMQITTIRGGHKPEYRDKIIKSLKKRFNSSSYINWSRTSLDEQKVNWVINYALLEGNGSPSKPDYGVYLHTTVLKLPSWNSNEDFEGTLKAQFSVIS